MKIWGSVLLAALMLGSASLAAAESGWVVWKKTISADSEAWSTQDVYLNESQCQGFGIMRALTDDVRSARNHAGYQDFDPGPDGRSYSFTKSTPDGSGTEPVQVRFVCLPDTIDPRDKKQ